MASVPAISIQKLRKVYTVNEREAGLLAAVRSLVRRRTRDVVAVSDLSFEVEAGEMVGFLGPNGAGKTTTLKMLAGLLHPTSGEANVLGHTPWKREKDLLRQITMVMGQRNQLVWDIPTIDSFELNRAIYRITPSAYRKILDELTDLLDLAPLLHKPVRTLSLGERMKCEIAAALLHKPQILFLDEPTIGLDVVMQRRIRSFIGEYNRRFGASVLLTSHYMADVEALCKRVVIIHHGALLFDGDLSALIDRFSPYKTIVVSLETMDDEHVLERYGKVIERQIEEGRAVLQVPKDQTASVTSRLLADLPIRDFTIEDPAIDTIIEQVFEQEAVCETF
ncbi:ABC transporter [Reticulibacter mediterranei]|uniref:ABC transporter n=1 Tax=Reticulibacter mediterranei TaxID=2778369 RepID=A0A8J3N0N6_9CHLR|nr:ATP-binding cassette domain-containing protein [Reticulibacter mediterranei]GHO94404.1 ABC transporter [Reticulibacter mediterranei]